MSDTDDLLHRALARAAAQRRLPESTYRLQFHKDFTFRDATAIIPYLADLGITHVYASPYLRATPGSTHGYDVIDHCRLNPELGTQDDFDAFLRALAGHGMSHILDTVPNHVGVATNENPWWNDVLARGPSSRYGAYFDIAWEGSPRPELHGKALLPLLGSPYGEVLEKGELKLTRDDVGSYWVNYYARRFPISPNTPPARKGETPDQALARLNGTPRDARSFDALHELLERQHYRLAFWRTASDEINYRRFFDINDLAALSMERPDVFEETHKLIMGLLGDGRLAGLRIDHPDGLYDPKEYFLRLQRRYIVACANAELDANPPPAGVDRERALAELAAHVAAMPFDASMQLPLYVVVEKILAMGEPLPRDWPTSGTSGYDFLNMAKGLFVDSTSESAFTAMYRDWTGENTSFEDLIYAKKKLILEISFASELHMLAHRLDRLAQRNRGWRDFTLGGLIHGLREVIACFPVYRSYITNEGVPDADIPHVDQAVNDAIRRNPRTDPSVFHFIRDAVLQRYPSTFTADDRAAQLAFAGRFQQLTAPVTAKGIEDTAFYLANRFVSLNEVGGEPSRFGISPDALHRYFADRQASWPHALSALSTHDTKRSEDVRARLNVLSELPDEWRRHVEQWRKLNEPLHRRVGDLTAPDPNDEYLIYQTLVGAWPLDDLDVRSSFVKRIQAYLQKAMREAKVFTSWTNPNEEYEQAVSDFIAGLFDLRRSGSFLASIRPFVRRVSRPGLVNSLAQTLLRLTAPGVPDTYQGTELWDFSLVDPDNRRPVDYDSRRAALADLRQRIERAGDDRRPLATELMQSLDDGRAKLYVTTLALHVHRANPGLFSAGEYLPLRATGVRAEHLFAFARRAGDRTAVALLPRLIATTLSGQTAWDDTSVQLPSGPPLRNLFTGQSVDTNRPLLLKDVFQAFPVALFVSE